MKRLLCLTLLTTLTFLTKAQTPAQIQIRQDLNKCSSSVWVLGYEPKEFTSPEHLDRRLRKIMQEKFETNFGPQLSKKVILAVGYEYNLDSLYTYHWEEIKSYKWEIPQYYLNYAFYDTISQVTYCMEFMISKHGKILKGSIPKINEKYYNSTFISKETAIYLIGKRKIKIQNLSGFDLRSSEVVFNNSKGIFEWQFGHYDKIWVEATPNAEIRMGKGQNSQ